MTKWITYLKMVIGRITGTVPRMKTNILRARKSMVGSSNLLQPIIETARINYAGDTWTHNAELVCRLDINKQDNAWVLGVDISSVPLWNDPFSNSAHRMDFANKHRFSDVDDAVLVEAVKAFPKFINGYMEEIKTLDTVYADIRYNAMRIQDNIRAVSDET